MMTKSSFLPVTLVMLSESGTDFVLLTPSGVNS